MRSAAINLRVLPEQRSLIDHAACLLGKNRSDFIENIFWLETSPIQGDNHGRERHPFHPLSFGPAGCGLKHA
jgi:hypothetical protein